MSFITFLQLLMQLLHSMSSSTVLLLSVCTFGNNAPKKMLLFSSLNRSEVEYFLVFSI